jgi:hypothetical protein
VNRRLPAILEWRQPTLGCGGVAVRSTSGEVVFALGAPLNVNGRTANSARVAFGSSRCRSERQSFHCEFSISNL